MKEMMKKLEKCLDCSVDISNTHYNRKRCADCAKKIALFQGHKSVKKWKAAMAAVLDLRKSRGEYVQTRDHTRR